MEFVIVLLMCTIIVMVILAIVLCNRDKDILGGTQSQYDRLTIGMPYVEVVQILGERGEVVEEQDDPEYFYWHMVMKIHAHSSFPYSNSHRFRSIKYVPIVIYARFRNGYLIEKDIVGSTNSW